MPRSLESRFLLDTLRVFVRGNDALPDLGMASRLDSNRLLSAAHFHRVAPLAYKIISKLDPERFPVSIVQSFRLDATHIALHSLRMSAEMLRLLNSLEAEGIPTVAFKGPTLAIHAYGDLFLRQFDDVDLIVRTPDFDRARSFLSTQGCVDPIEVPHACTFFHAKWRTAVDLHRWVPGPLGYAGSRSLTMDPEALFTRAGYLDFRGHRIRAFELEDLLLVLCLHGAKHAWRRWIWLLDIAALIAHHPDLDWDRLTQRSRELGFTEPVYLSLRLTETVCGSTLPPGVLQGFRVRPAIERLIPSLDFAIVQDPNSMWSDLRRLLLPFQTLRTARDKRNYLFRILKERMALTSADRTALWLPRYLHFLYFVIRPLRLTFVYGRDVMGYLFLKLGRNRRIHEESNKP